MSTLVFDTHNWPKEAIDPPYQVRARDTLLNKAVMRIQTRDSGILIAQQPQLLAMFRKNDIVKTIASKIPPLDVAISEVRIHQQIVLSVPESTEIGLTSIKIGTVAASSPLGPFQMDARCRWGGDLVQQQPIRRLVVYEATEYLTKLVMQSTLQRILDPAEMQGKVKVLQPIVAEKNQESIAP